MAAVIKMIDLSLIELSLADFGRSPQQTKQEEKQNNFDNIVANDFSQFFQNVMNVDKKASSSVSIKSQKGKRKTAADINEPIQDDYMAKKKKVSDWHMANCQTQLSMFNSEQKCKTCENGC